MSKFAIDCEMVGIKDGKSLLARVSIVDQHSEVVLDKYVKPTSVVKDYRNFVSGIKLRDLENGEDFSLVKEKVAHILRGQILIGHSLKFDLDALGLSHPESNRRDLAKYAPLMKNGQPVALKSLAKDHLGRNIQNGEHSSVEDAKACMDLYRQFARDWERNY